MEYVFSLVDISSVLSGGRKFAGTPALSNTGFVVMAPVLPLSQWLILTIYHGQLLAPGPLLFLYLAAIITYPVVAELINMARVRLLKI